MPISMRSFAPFAVLLLASAPIAAAEMYKWVDERGVVNYSNEPPPKMKGGTAPTIVEDRVSVYTPEKAVTEAIQRGKDGRGRPAASAQREPEPARSAKAAPPPPPPVYDPCANPNDRNCQAGVLYDGSPVFHGRHRQQPLVQPQLPPGAIAGQIAGPNAYIPGLSGSAPRVVPPVRAQTAPLRDQDRETSRRQP